MSHTGRAVAVILSAMSLSCAARVHTLPDLDTPPMVVSVLPDQPWMDTGIVVKRDELYVITASGEVCWALRQRAAGPDGINGSLGWYVGAGGLVGRIGSGPAFDIGARTHPFRSTYLRSRKQFPPPPVRIPSDGELFLGFKDFRSGPNTGAFEVTIRRASSRHL